MTDPRIVPDREQLRADLLSPKGPYSRLDVVDDTGSTNADLLELPDEWASDRSVLIARYQDSARGRLGRSWSAPMDTQLAVSVLYRPDPVELSRIGLMPIIAGMAITDVIDGFGLKWPNDVQIDGRKVCGILAEAAELSSPSPRVVLGMGINTTLKKDDLPVDTATSLLLEDNPRAGDITGLARDLLLALENRVAKWRTMGGKLPGDYRERCVSIGLKVRLETPTGDVYGIVDDVTDEGEIVLVGTAGKTQTYSAGDVTHLRPAS